jgi:hypothetical protein
MGQIPQGPVDMGASKNQKTLLHAVLEESRDKHGRVQFGLIMYYLAQQGLSTVKSHVDCHADLARNLYLFGLTFPFLLWLLWCGASQDAFIYFHDFTLIDKQHSNL